MRKIIQKDRHDLVIMDEVNIALYYKLIKVDELIELIRNKPCHVELVLTGRYAPQELIKHYYQQGIEARKGIEY